ncbi:MAG: hypothetical protein JJU34_15430 [Lunatimonas sp.]|uniref:hypothetical protein n=1 Tax=Lunatimonas sp. TaxID=2060141 RepID=UPI00263AF801|nr:hypothetical protein [Lunatimonas sp.]MCC5938672.1 hypothetical protein [Lunatimonas sp.]
MRLLLPLFLFLFAIVGGYAQEADSLAHKPQHAIKGTLGLRSYWMSTGYWEDFKSDFALGQSAFLRLTTRELHGFSLVGRYTVFGNLWSSDLSAPDPVTNNVNRYEVGLFDVNNPSDRLFGKIEELQLRYRSERFDVVAGRMDINTPFLNPQDGRLSPTFVEGVRVNVTPGKSNTLSAQYIGKISPRSTSGWFQVGETVGVYPVGQGEFGGPSNYQGNTESRFVTVIDWIHQNDADVQLQLNHTYVDNISSTAFLQVLKEWQLATNQRLVAGFQFTSQHGVGEGGNPDPTKRYKNPDDFNFVIGSRVGIKSKRTTWWLNYSRIDGRGRFLHPREWGKDPFFTFIPRERNEGFSDVNAFTAYYQRNVPDKGLQIYGFSGLHFLPDPGNTEVNKYAFPSYAQANLGGRYTPKNWGKGMDFHLILMSKVNLKSGEMRPQWVYNKVNLMHLNLIMNYTIQYP